MSRARINIGRIVVKTNRPISAGESRELRAAVAAELSRVRSPQSVREIAGAAERAGSRVVVRERGPKP